MRVLQIVFRYYIQCRYVDYTRVPGESENISRVPDYFVIMEEFRLSVPLVVDVALEEPAATTVNRVIADVTQMVS
jgi:hypothetical protein